jgi:transglutaminase-like putative cysteine protease
MLAVALGVLPLVDLFTEARWLFDAYAAIAIVGGTAALLRLRYQPRVWHTWAGVALLALFLTWRFVPEHAIAGFIPTAGTGTDISHLLHQVRSTINDGVAPVPADRPITALLALVAGLLTAFVDLVAVMARRPAIAGIPLLIVFTVAGAVTRRPVGWLFFAAGAVGFLLLLSIDARDEVRTWGRLIPRAGEPRPTAALGVSGPRIAAVAALLAIAIPYLVPTRGSNVLANALHNSSSSAGGAGIGTGGVSLDPMASLKGELLRTKPVTLFRVTVTPSNVDPFYVRANVLSTFTLAGWQAASHEPKESIGATQFNVNPPVADPTGPAYQARLNIVGLSDNPPVFARPQSVNGAPGDASWSQSDQLLVDTHVSNGDQMVQTVVEPAPSIADLGQTGTDYPPSVRDELDVPSGIPAMVGRLVNQIVAGKTSPYAKAKALSDFFTDPANGFNYSLQTKAGDSGNALVDFLTNRSGFCQQFAAAMGIMLRMAGIPARVVLGYTHGRPDRGGTFTVTTDNAHAWVEAFFPGIGWVPFDPTPLSASPGAATTNLVWAPHPAGVAPSNDVIPTPKNSAGRAPQANQSNGPSGGTARTHTATQVAWPVLWTVVALSVLACLTALPAAVRRQRRRRRLHASRAGPPDPLWAELSDTATDLGYVWSPTRSPRQVADWLGPDVGPTAARSLQTLAAAVERSRYADLRSSGSMDDGTDTSTASLLPELKDVEAGLRRHRSRRTRIRSRLWPASLGWLRRPNRR